MQTTTRTFVDVVGKGEFLPVSAPVTVLGRVGRVDLDQLPAGAFSLVGEHGEEPGPGRVRNAFGQSMIMDHAVDAQVLNADDSVVVDDLPGELVGKIIPPKPDAFMNPGDDLAPPSPLGSSFSRFVQFPLRFGQGFFFLPEEPGILNESPVREHGKSVQAHVDTHGLIAGREKLRLNLAAKGHIPLAGGRAADGGRFGLAAHLPVHDDLDMADLGYRQPTVFEAAAGRNLGEGDGIVPALAFEARIAGFFARFHPAEKGFEGQIQPKDHILQNLGMGQVEILGYFDSRQQFFLKEIAQGSLLNLPGVFTLAQQTVVEIPALLQNSFKDSRLLSGEKYPVFESLKHK
jgi:hypothetical protein